MLFPGILLPSASEIIPKEKYGFHDSVAFTYAIFISNLERKIGKIPHIRSGKKEFVFRDEMIKRYIEGQNIIKSLHDNYPDVYNSLLKCKGNREGLLVLESLIHQDSSANMLKDSLERYREELIGEVRGVARQTIEKLVYEGVADWLMRCPLDFPEEQHEAK